MEIPINELGKMRDIEYYEADGVAELKSKRFTDKNEAIEYAIQNYKYPIVRTIKNSYVFNCERLFQS